jgi:hypothetical protein
MKKADLLLACVVFLCGSSPMFGGTGNPATDTAQPAAAPRAAEAYSGVIVSMNGERYILRDDTNDTWYHLDDQQQAGKFLGKKVWVTGKLNTRTDVIHVQQITETNQ